MMLARVMVLACVMVLTRGMVLTMTSDGQEDAGICSSCGLCAYSWMCGCGSGWKYHPHYPRINICKKIGPEVGQPGSFFNSKCQKYHYCLSFLGFIHLQEYKSRIIIIWLKQVDFFYYLIRIWCAMMHIGQYSRMAILSVDPCYGVYPCYDVNTF